MKHVVLRSAMMLALLLACVGIGSAQKSNDLLQTGSGTQEDLSSKGLGTPTNPVRFQGVPVSAETGAADTIVQHDPFTGPGTQVNMRIVALHLQSIGTVSCDDLAHCGDHTGQQVTVHAIINVPDNPAGCLDASLPTTQDLSSGTLTQTSDSAFDSVFGNIQAQIIAIANDGVTVINEPGPPTGMSATGGVLSPSPPDGYPNSTCFPTIAPFVISVAGGPAPLFVGGTAGRVFRASLWGLGGLFLGLAVLAFRSSVKNGRLNLRPVYLAGLAVLAWFVAWRTPSYPRIVYANGATNGLSVIGTSSCTINFEQATLIQHGVAPAMSTACTVGAAAIRTR